MSIESMLTGAIACVSLVSMVADIDHQESEVTRDEVLDRAYTVANESMDPTEKARLLRELHLCGLYATEAARTGALQRELIGSLEDSEQEWVRDATRKHLAVSHILAGDIAKAREFIDACESVQGHESSLATCCTTLSARGEFATAMEWAQDLRNQENANRVMSTIAIEATQGGDTTGAAQAMRGYNPVSVEDFGRKLVTSSKLACLNALAGRVDYARSLMRQNKMFAESLRISEGVTFIVRFRDKLVMGNPLDQLVKESIEELREIESDNTRDRRFGTIVNQLLENDEIELARRVREEIQEEFIRDYFGALVGVRCVELKRMRCAESLMMTLKQSWASAPIDLALAKQELTRGRKTIARRHLQKARMAIVQLDATVPEMFALVYEIVELQASIGDAQDALEWVPDTWSSEARVKLLVHIAKGLSGEEHKD